MAAADFSPAPTPSNEKAHGGLGLESTKKKDFVVVKHSGIRFFPAGSENRLTNVVEGTAGGWRDLEEAWVDERSEGRRRLVFLHVVTRLALKSDRIET